jgi:hypothetical protein
MSPRPRDRILANLETIYREAYNKASAAADTERMQQLDASYQREQLMLEVLLDIRDAMMVLGQADNSKSALEKLDALRKLTKLR